MIKNATFSSTIKMKNTFLSTIQRSFTEGDVNLIILGKNCLSSSALRVFKLSTFIHAHIHYCTLHILNMRDSHRETERTEMKKERRKERIKERQKERKQKEKALFEPTARMFIEHCPICCRMPT